MGNRRKNNYSPFTVVYAKIYTLSTYDGNVFYVGCTTQSAKHRLRLHINEARIIHKLNTASKKCQYIRNVNYEININVIDEKWITGTSTRDIILKASNLEYFYMQQYILKGVDLCNIQLNPKKALQCLK